MNSLALKNKTKQNKSAVLKLIYMYLKIIQQPHAVHKTEAINNLIFNPFCNVIFISIIIINYLFNTI